MSDSVAVIVAHPDDEVLGCGATLARMARDGWGVHVLILADGETSRGRDVPRGQVAARGAAAERACKVLGCVSLKTLSLPDNRLDGLELLELVKHVETFLADCKPSAVLTHHSGDVNIDHRVTHDAVVTACRPHPGQSVEQLLFFEVPSSTEWRPPASAEAFLPNWFVDVSSTLATKLEALREYESELRPFPHPRSIKAIEALARWRGATAGVDAAEAFVLGRNTVK